MVGGISAARTPFAKVGKRKSLFLWAKHVIIRLIRVKEEEECHLSRSSYCCRRRRCFVLRAWEINKWKRCSENGRETKKVVGLCFGFLIIEKTKTKNVCLLIYNHQSLNFSYIVFDYFLLLWEKSVKIIYKYISVS